MKNNVLYLAILLFFGANLFGQNVMPKPTTYLSVVDETSTLTASENMALTKKLDAFKATTGHELVIVLVQSLNGNNLEAYANTLFNNWGIGKVGKDDGVLILIAINDRKMRIETGYAAEAVLTDVEAARVLDELLTPHFKRKEFYEGLELASNYIINQLNSDFGFETYAIRKTDEVRGLDLSTPKKQIQYIAPKSDEKPVYLFFLLYLLSFGLQLLAGYFILKPIKDGYVNLILVSCSYFVVGLVMMSIFLEDSNAMYPTIIWATIICISIYLLTLLPKKVGKFVGQIFYYLFMLFMAAMLALIPSIIFIFISENIIFLLVVFCCLTALFFFLIVTGRINLEGGGGGGGSYSSSGYSSSYSDYGGSSYSDSSSSYSDSSYGGGSSGGGGASGSW